MNFISNNDELYINEFICGSYNNNNMFSPMQSPVTPIATTLKHENTSLHLICDPVITQIGEEKPQMLSPPATPHSTPHHPSRHILSSVETPKKSPITKSLKVNVSNNNVATSTNTVDAAVAEVSSPALSSSTVTTTTASTAPIKVTATTNDQEEENLNPKQINRIIKRRIAREKFKKKHNIPKQRKPYIHESRHIHALRRPRGPGGRFLTNSAEKVLQTYNNNINSTCHFDPYNTSPQQQQQYIENPWGFMANNMNMNMNAAMMNSMNMNAVDINTINAMNPYNLVIDHTDDCSSATSSSLSSPTSYHPTTITTKIDDEPIYTHDTSIPELYVLPFGTTSPTTTYSSPPFVTNDSNNAVINNTVINNAANYVWDNSINLI